MYAHAAPCVIRGCTVASSLNARPDTNLAPKLVIILQLKKVEKQSIPFFCAVLQAMGHPHSAAAEQALISCNGMRFLNCALHRTPVPKPAFPEIQFQDAQGSRIRHQAVASRLVYHADILEIQRTVLQQQLDTDASSDDEEENQRQQLIHQPSSISPPPSEDTPPFCSLNIATSSL